MKKLFRKLYIPAILFLCILAVVGLLPQAACAYLTHHAMAVVAIINLCLALFLGFGLLFLPAMILAAPYSDPMYPIEGEGNQPEETALAARAAVV